MTGHFYALAQAAQLRYGGGQELVQKTIILKLEVYQETVCSK